MKPGRLLVGIFLLSAELACLIGAALLWAEPGSPGGSQPNEDSVLEYLAPALSSAGEGARLYYRTECDMRKSQMWDPVPFPRVDVQPPSKGAKGLAAVREIFRSDQDVLVTEGPSGIIRIRIGNPPGRVLQARIRRLKLDALERQFPEWTVYGIEKAGDVRAAMRGLHAKAAPYSPPLVSARVIRGAPHLPSAMRNVTLEQVLDLTASTFKGIVVYGACTQPSGRSFYRLDYVGLPIVPTSSRTVRNAAKPGRTGPRRLQ